MSRRAWGYGIAAALLLWALVVAAIILWHWVLLALLGIFCWKVLAAQLGLRKGRRGSSFARNVTAVSAAYAAWNSRWLNPAQFKARMGRAKGAWPDSDAPGGIALSEDYKWPEGY